MSSRKPLSVHHNSSCFLEKQRGGSIRRAVNNWCEVRAFIHSQSTSPSQLHVHLAFSGFTWKVLIAAPYPFPNAERCAVATKGDVDRVRTCGYFSLCGLSVKSPAMSFQMDSDHAQREECRRKQSRPKGWAGVGCAVCAALLHFRKTPLFECMFKGKIDRAYGFSCHIPPYFAPFLQNKIIDEVDKLSFLGFEAKSLKEKGTKEETEALKWLSTRHHNQERRQKWAVLVWGRE